MLIDVALAVLALAFACGLLRAAIGPTVADRAVAADVCLYAVVAAVALLALRSGAEAFIDVVLVATLLGFLATVALGAMISRMQS
jgi:multicomponent Na+:H+ antiporter subunit F